MPVIVEVAGILMFVVGIVCAVCRAKGCQLPAHNAAHYRVSLGLVRDAVRLPLVTAQCHCGHSRGNSAHARKYGTVS